MENKSRSHFLKHDWRPYPTRPASHDLAGRVKSIEQNEIEVANRKFIIEDFWRGILRPGDWVSGLSEGKKLKNILMLAPSMNRSFTEKIGEERWLLHQKFMRMVSLVERYFIEEGFFKTMTPTLVNCPGTEPSLDAFVTEFHLGAKKKTLYLPTSPELHLKKIIAERGECVFEIRPVFRNGEVTDLHQPEFLMVEWYRPFAGLEEIKQDCIGLVSYLIDEAKQIAHKFSAPTGTISRSLAQCFTEVMNFQLQPTTSRDELLELVKNNGISLGGDLGRYSFDDLFFIILAQKIEPSFAKDKLFFLESYPPSQAALARVSPSGWGERFELYWQGMELANAFHELNNPDEQRSRALKDITEKQKMGKNPIPIDEDFLHSLAGGFPPTAGIALGLDRLFMALTGESDITSFRLFPLK